MTWIQTTCSGGHELMMARLIPSTNLVSEAADVVDPALLEVYRASTAPPEGLSQRVTEAVLVASTFHPWTTGAVSGLSILAVATALAIVLGLPALAALGLVVGLVVGLVSGVVGTAYVRGRLLADLASLSASRSVPTRLIPALQYIARSAPLDGGGNRSLTPDDPGNY
jgi:hypothetical protein